MWDSLAKFKREFLLYYDFMATDNEENIPHCNAKEGGLIKIFIDKLPDDYGFIKFGTMDKQRFRNIRLFIDEFWKKVKIDYDNAKCALSVSKSFKQSVPTETYRTTKDTPYKPNPESKPFRKTTYDNNRQSFNAIKEEVTPSKETKTNKLKNDEDSMSMSEDNSISASEEDSHASGIQTPDSAEEITQQIHELQFISNPPRKPAILSPDDRRDQLTKPREKLACYKLLLNNKCDNPKCTFSHDENLLKEAYKKLYSQLQDQKPVYGDPSIRRNLGEQVATK
jgi:hypothetical protein